MIPSDLVEFTDEEGYGRYLDLHDCYLKYINLKASEVRPYPRVESLILGTKARHLVKPGRMSRPPSNLYKH